MNICKPERAGNSSERRLPAGNRMYLMHELARHGLGLVDLSIAASTAAGRLTIKTAERFGVRTPITEETTRRLGALAEMSHRIAREYPKPEYGLKTTEINGEQVPVREVVVEKRAFGDLLRFERQTDRHDPPVLLVAPMSGHYSTLLRDTVRQLLPSHDVYITDWKNARDVPLEAGNFDLDTYIDYMIDFIKKLGPDTNVIAVCQATVPSLAAISYLAEHEPNSQPLTMTLMGGPLDVGAAATSVTDFANRTSIDLIKRSWITTVPGNYEGRGRQVYPGYIQLQNFMSMNRQRHVDAHLKLFRLLAEGGTNPESAKEAQKIKDFYDEYFAVADLSADFYLQTIQRVFKERQLARGTMRFRDELLRPTAITRTGLLTVEGSEDDISAPGQTLAVHQHLTSLDPKKQFHYTQEGAGHYGIFNGKAWGSEIAPRISGFIRQMANEEGIAYDEPAAKLITPTRL
ncbi:polyhydroxyalkanoate depolymerase [Candidatus Saccharibacteria bacterium]|nr:MAG: polyhydroxyalkanoate depolymerase [Candidatus Saccharibacteria bacterium]